MKPQEERVKTTCIICPTGCEIEVTKQGKKVIDVKGFTCDRGKEYAIEEVVSPKRVLTTTVNIENARILFLPVRTNKPIPREKLIQCMKALRKVVVRPPIQVGDVIAKNILGLGADVVATRSVEAIS